MEKPSILFLLLILMFFLVLLGSHPVVADRAEHWGYTTVRQVTETQAGAHLFWWYYESGLELEDSSSKWPIILWLEGGPGSSGVGFGNFLQIGPMTVANEERPYTWLSKADLLFVDSPVGTGFSFVDDDSLLVKTDQQAAHDLLFLLKDLSHQLWSSFKNRPLYIYGEGYGGKVAAYLGVLVNQAIVERELELQPPGAVILADSWISPDDSVLALGDLLKDFSRISSNGFTKAHNLARTIQYLLSNGQYRAAKLIWNHLKTVIAESSANVDLHNFRFDANEPSVGITTIYGSERIMRTSDLKNYSTHILPNDQTPFDFSRYMNEDIKRKFGNVIPEKVKWIQSNQKVFDAMSDDYMKPAIEEVKKLLAREMSVTIISGQYDVLCSSKGAKAWVAQLTGWPGLESFFKTDSEALDMFYVQSNLESKPETAAFLQSHGNLAFYSIFKAGHYVMVDQPDLLQLIVAKITNSPPTKPTTVPTKVLRLKH